MNRIALSAALLLAAVAGFLGYELSSARAAEATLDRQMAALKVEVAHAQARADSLQRAYRTDTVRLWRAVTRYDSTRVTDTLVRVDSVTHETVVYVPRAVADTAIRACTLALRTCEQRVAAADSLTALARSEATVTGDALTAARRTGRWAKVGWALAGLAVGRLAR